MPDILNKLRFIGRGMRAAAARPNAHQFSTYIPVASGDPERIVKAYSTPESPLSFIGDINKKTRSGDAPIIKTRHGSLAIQPEGGKFIDPDGPAYIDAENLDSRGKKGGQGAQAYQAALSVIRGMPTSNKTFALSDINRVRKPMHVMSSGLRHGDLDHVLFSDEFLPHHWLGPAGYDHGSSLTGDESQLFEMFNPDAVGGPKPMMHNFARLHPDEQIGVLAMIERSNLDKSLHRQTSLPLDRISGVRDMTSLDSYLSPGEMEQMASVAGHGDSSIRRGLFTNRLADMYEEGATNPEEALDGPWMPLKKTQGMFYAGGGKITAAMAEILRKQAQRPPSHSFMPRGALGHEPTLLVPHYPDSVLSSLRGPDVGRASDFYKQLAGKGSPKQLDMYFGHMKDRPEKVTKAEFASTAKKRQLNAEPAKMAAANDMRGLDLAMDTIYEDREKQDQIINTLKPEFGDNVITYFNNRDSLTGEQIDDIEEAIQDTHVFDDLLNGINRDLRDMAVEEPHNGGTQYADYQRLGDRDNHDYFESVLSDPSVDWVHTRQINPASDWDSHFSNPSQLGHVRGSTNNKGRVLIEELQSDPVETFAKDPRLADIHPTLAKYALERAARSNAKSIMFPSAEAIGSVRDAKSQNFYDDIYDTQLNKKFFGPLHEAGVPIKQPYQIFNPGTDHPELYENYPTTSIDLTDGVRDFIFNGGLKFKDGGVVSDAFEGYRDAGHEYGRDMRDMFAEERLPEFRPGGPNFRAMPDSLAYRAAAGITPWVADPLNMLPFHHAGKAYQMSKPYLKKLAAMAIAAGVPFASTFDDDPMAGSVMRGYQRGGRVQNQAFDLTPLDVIEKHYNLPVGLLSAMEKKESNGNFQAVSPKGAQGRFQLMPAISKSAGIDPLDPEASAWHAGESMSGYLKQFRNDLVKSLAAWNWGQGNMSKMGMDKMPPETRNFIDTIVPQVQMPNAAQQVQQAPGGPQPSAPMPMGPAATAPEQSGLDQLAQADLSSQSGETDPLSNDDNPWLQQMVMDIVLRADPTELAASSDLLESV